MPLRPDLLNPIPGDNPAGVSLRYDPVYDKIKEARREDAELPQGVWQEERKVADFPFVIKQTQELLATKSKDLQLAAWLAEALLKTQGFGGFRDGLALCRGLLESFWDSLYPELEDGDAELRATPLEWVGTKLQESVGDVPITKDGYSFVRHKESRAVGYEAQATSKPQQEARAKALKEGKLAPEDFDKSFTETPKAFYLQSEKDLDGCLEGLDALDKLCRDKFGDLAPTFSKLKDALEAVRHVVHGLLQKKRETEPDPVEEAPPEAAAAGEGAPAGAPAAGAVAGFVIPALGSSEPADRRDAVASVAGAAAFLRKREPRSPAPYLMMRGLRWGELRAAAAADDLTMLEAPPTEARFHVKKLALDGKWKDLLEVAENLMALPCARAWLDMQRFVVEACVHLGSDYDLIAIAIRSELKTLLRDVPQLLDATLMDDTPVANAETRAWIQDMMKEPEDAAPKLHPEPPFSFNGEPAAWHRKFIDAYQLAGEALRAKEEQKAFEIMYQEIQNQRSGRGRFQRRLQLVQLCVSSGKEAIAQPLLDDLFAAIDTHKLEDWEDRQVVAAALLTLMKASKKIQGNAGEKQKLFDRICRLDPVQALGAG